MSVTRLKDQSLERALNRPAPQFQRHSRKKGIRHGRDEHRAGCRARTDPHCRRRAQNPRNDPRHTTALDLPNIESSRAR